jgi:hypothetical protein
LKSESQVAAEISAGEELILFRDGKTAENSESFESEKFSAISLNLFAALPRKHRTRAIFFAT